MLVRLGAEQPDGPHAVTGDPAGDDERHPVRRGHGLFLGAAPVWSAAFQLRHVTGTEWALLVGGLVIGMAIGETMYLAAIKEIGVSRAMAMSGDLPARHVLFRVGPAAESVQPEIPSSGSVSWPWG